MIRLAFDLSKAADPDGIGTWQRETARALVATDAVELRACWLLARGEADRRAREQAVREALGEAADAVRWTAASGPAGPAGSKSDIDLLVSSAWAVPELPADLASVPSIYVVHDLTFLTHPEFHTLDNRLGCLEGILRARLLSETQFVAVSEATARVLSERLDLPAEQVSVVPNGVDSRWRPIDAKEARASLASALSTEEGAPADFVLFVGSLEPRKNLAGLLDAHRRLPEALRNRHPLVVAGGQGWHTDALRAELAADAHVRLLGRVSDETLLALYNCCGLFVYPSLAEGFGLPVAEALACGAPVLTSSTTSLPEVAGDAAVLVEPTDGDALAHALRRLLEDPDERRRLSAAGPERAACFTWTATAEGLLRVAHRARPDIAPAPLPRDPCP